MPAYGSLAIPFIRISGTYYGPRPHGSATNTPAENRMTLAPAILRAGSYDRIRCRVTTLAASSAVRLGVYDSTEAGTPRNRLLDAGTVDATTNGTKEITVALTIPADGVYWLAAVSQGGTPVLNAIPAASDQSYPMFGHLTVPATAAHGVFEDSVSGALPATATFAAANNTTVPTFVDLRAA